MESSSDDDLAEQVAEITTTTRDIMAGELRAYVSGGESSSGSAPGHPSPLSFPPTPGRFENYDPDEIPIRAHSESGGSRSVSRGSQPSPLIIPLTPGRVEDSDPGEEAPPLIRDIRVSADRHRIRVPAIKIHVPRPIRPMPRLHARPLGEVGKKGRTISQPAVFEGIQAWMTNVLEETDMSEKPGTSRQSCEPLLEQREVGPRQGAFQIGNSEAAHQTNPSTSSQRPNPPYPEHRERSSPINVNEAAQRNQRLLIAIAEDFDAAKSSSGVSSQYSEDSKDSMSVEDILWEQAEFLRATRMISPLVTASSGDSSRDSRIAHDSPDVSVEVTVHEETAHEETASHSRKRHLEDDVGEGPSRKTSTSLPPESSCNEAGRDEDERPDTEIAGSSKEISSESEERDTGRRDSD